MADAGSEDGGWWGVAPGAARGAPAAAAAADARGAPPPDDTGSVAKTGSEAVRGRSPAVLGRSRNDGIGSDAAAGDFANAGPAHRVEEGFSGVRAADADGGGGAGVVRGCSAECEEPRRVKRRAGEAAAAWLLAGVARDGDAAACGGGGGGGDGGSGGGGAGGGA